MPTDTVALLANEARFFRFRVYFGACSFQNEVGDPPFFFYLFGKSRSLPFCVTNLKKSVRGNFWARMSLREKTKQNKTKKQAVHLPGQFITYFKKGPPNYTSLYCMLTLIS